MPFCNNEGDGCGEIERENKEYLQPLKCRFNIWELEKYGPVRDTLIIKHKSDAPYSGREADILGACQVVQDNLGFGLGGHIGFGS